VGLLENHPELYAKAAKYERIDLETDEKYTWSSKESLEEMRDPARISQIKAEYLQRQQAKSKEQANKTLTQVFMDNDSDNEGCLICHL